MEFPPSLSSVIQDVQDSISSFFFGNDDKDLLQSSYTFKSHVFPADINHDYNGHYMVININVPVNIFGNPRGSSRTIEAYGGAGGFLGDEYSKVDVLRFGEFAGQRSDDVNRAMYSYPRSTRRIKESIALFMPNPIVYSDVNEYEEVSLTGMVNGTISALLSYGSGVAQGVVGDLGAIYNDLGQAVGAVAGLAGRPINPRVEIVFATTRQRQFTFEVLMAPRNEEESENIRNIVKSLRFHSKPELDSITFNGLGVPLYIPPAEFDITFFTRGVENTNLPRINTCVLERIDVDYAPTGVYSTFTNGHPVAVRMSLGFREVEPLNKLRVLQGF